MPLAVHRSFSGEPSADLAKEEVLVSEVGRSGPTLLLYGWDRPVLVLGRGQRLDTIDRAACAREGIPILPRITGGTGVLHHGDLAASLVLPTTHPWSADIRGLYARFLDVVQSALASLGVHVERGSRPVRGRGRSPICFEDHALESLLVEGRKAVGCAQARRRTGVLVHGTLLLGLDAALQARVFGVDEAHIRAIMAPLDIPRDVPRDALADLIAEQATSALTS